ncbi:hypothetical protein [Bythopirellula polymerisocia]|uniref:Uncharacterized protein n=1 Tax=Bythopirellula polymerisocia TaxID=2528003 RepID=A0A5C6CVT1_9BACT|nr:hypothetical protein [Bythopirellula polymerisocia]TWU27784.1 hypothetical protein Pla144_25610 [Bythopirellula polymerisocia]
MARTYACIFALLGMIVVLLRAIKNGAGFDGTIMQAMATTVLLAVVGMIVGMIAQATVDESTRNQLQAELDALAEVDQSQPTS